MDNEKYYPNIDHQYPIIQWIATIFGSLGLLSCGMHYGWSSPSLPQLLNNASIIYSTKEDIFLIPVAMPAGGFCGTIIAAFLMSKMGRKRTALLGAIPLILSWLLIAQANCVLMIIVARLFAGLSGAIISSGIPVYIAEISEPRKRGLLLSLVTIMWIIGVLFMNILGSYFTIRNAAYIALMIPILFFTSFLWMPESPHYLIVKGKTKQAQKSLKILKGENAVDEELTRLCAAITIQKETKRSYKDLLRDKANKRSLIIMMGVRGVQQFCGSTALIYYAQIVFEEASSDVSPKIASIIYFSLFLIINGLSTLIVDKVGRKRLLLLSTATTAISLFTEACFFYIKNKTEMDTTGYSLIPIIGFIVYITTFSIGLQSIPLLIVGEIFPINIRPIAVCFAAVYYYACGIITVQIFQFTMNTFGLHVPFFIFCLFSLLGFIFILLYVPETKNLTLEEIEAKLYNR